MNSCICTWSFFLTSCSIGKSQIGQSSLLTIINIFDIYIIALLNHFEKIMEKSERVKKALGSLKEILLKKKITINRPEETSLTFDLIKKTEDENGVTYQIDESSHLFYQHTQQEITLDQLVSSLDSKVDNTGNISKASTLTS